MGQFSDCEDMHGVRDPV